MIHLYAVAREPWRVDIAGLQGRPVTALPVDGLVAAVTEHDAEVERTADAARTHAAVVAAISGEVDTLPVRFGPAHADASALTGRLLAVEDLHERLDRVGGHAEYVVRMASPVAGTDVPDVPDAGGRAYLEAIRDRDRGHAREHAARRQHLAAATDALRGEAAEVIDRDGPRGPERCLLVAADRQPAVERGLAGLRASGEFVVGGPWPPFTFAERTGTAVAS